MDTGVYAPDGEAGPAPVSLAAAPGVLAGLRIGVLDNGKPNARLLLTRVGEQLAARTGARLELVTDKGPGANAATPCPPAGLQRIRGQCDVAPTGTAARRSVTHRRLH